MPIPTITNLHQLLVLILSPLVLSLIGETSASILKQDGFDKYSPIWNEIIAWSVVLLFAVLSVVADNQFNGGLNAVADATIAAFSLLASGGLKSLKPWLTFTGWLQTATSFVQSAAQQSQATSHAPTTLATSDPQATNPRLTIVPPQPKPIMLVVPPTIDGSDTDHSG